MLLLPSAAPPSAHKFGESDASEGLAAALAEGAGICTRTARGRASPPAAETSVCWAQPSLPSGLQAIDCSEQRRAKDLDAVLTNRDAPLNQQKIPSRCLSWTLAVMLL